MPLTLVDDAAQFPAAITPATGDAFSIMRECMQRIANRTANLRQRLDQGVARIRVGTAEQMRALNATTISTGDTFLVMGQGLYFFDSSSTTASAPPWVYLPTSGAGRWIHELNALRGATEGIPFVTAGRVGLGQVANQLVSTPFWWSSTLNQTINGGTGPTNIAGATISLGTLATGDLVDVDLTLGNVQAVDLGSIVAVKISFGTIDQDVPGLGALKIPKRFTTNSGGVIAGGGRFVVTSAVPHTIRAIGIAAASSDIIVADHGSLRARVFRP